MPEGLSPRERIDLGPDKEMNILELHSLSEVREVLLSEPYFEIPKVKELMGIEDVQALILDGTLLAYKDHGDYLFPVFQFNPETGQPIETVSKVNVIMDALNDGWGVTAFWTQQNGRLPEHAAPKELLGTPSEYVAILIAEAMAQGNSY